MKMKLSDILEEAAQQFEDGTNWFTYSCIQVEDLVEQYIINESDYYKTYRTFLIGVSEMGLDTRSSDVFKNVPYEQRSQARALWLSWCAMMAREQGL